MQDIHYLGFTERKHCALPQWKPLLSQYSTPSSATNVARSLEIASRLVGQGGNSSIDPNKN